MELVGVADTDVEDESLLVDLDQSAFAPAKRRGSIRRRLRSWRGRHRVSGESTGRGEAGIGLRVHLGPATIRKLGLVAQFQKGTLMTLIPVILGQIPQNQVAVFALVLQAGLVEIEDQRACNGRDGEIIPPLAGIGDSRTCLLDRLLVLLEIITALILANDIEAVLGVVVIGIQSVNCFQTGGDIGRQRICTLLLIVIDC